MLGVRKNLGQGRPLAEAVEKLGSRGDERVGCGVGWKGEGLKDGDEDVVGEAGEVGGGEEGEGEGVERKDVSLALAATTQGGVVDWGTDHVWEKCLDD